MKIGYDMHIATEAGDSQKLKSALFALGFKDDRLAKRGLTYDCETAKHYTTCPLIDVHMSKKIPTLPELRELEIEMHKLMQTSDCVGYWHSECIYADNHLEPETDYMLKPLPFERLSSRPRPDEKVWDIHLAFREKLMPEGLSETLIGAGIYYLSRIKNVPEGGEENFAVYTVQGVSGFPEGERFYKEMYKWLKSVGVPTCDIKLELTTRMECYRNPQTVPPTVSEIIWK